MSPHWKGPHKKEYLRSPKKWLGATDLIFRIEKNQFGTWTEQSRLVSKKPFNAESTMKLGTS